MQKILLYGAYGYTGRLLTGAACSAGLDLILAGRNEEKLRPLSDKFDFPYVVVSINETERLEEALSEVSIVLNAAGPFVYTAEPMMNACIKTKTHYLDITGEIGVFEQAKSQDIAAKKASIMLMPGVGFDVVPTDCVALYLKKQMPDATTLELAFAPLGKAGASRGTALTMVENLGEAGAVRENGRIRREPIGKRTITLPYGDKRLLFLSIPWGDVSTAYFTTGIPNIVTYMGIAPRQYKWVRRQKYLNWLLRLEFVKKIARSKINKGKDGPTVEERFGSKIIVFGKVTNKQGDKKEVRLLVPNGYDVTTAMAIRITKKILDGDWKSGYQTPASCYTENLILELEGVNWELPVF